MKTRTISILGPPIIALLGITVSSDVNADMTIKRIVNCDKGMDVQRVLDRNFFSLPLELRLVGNCRSFSISHDDVAIFPRYDDVCPGATIQGTVEIEGGAIVEMSCIDVVYSAEEEGEAGLMIIGSQATFENVNVRGFSEAGATVDAGGWMEFIGGTLSGNNEGVVLQFGYAVLEDVDISNNDGNAIRAENNSYVEFGGGAVMNNGEYGIEIASSSVLSMEETIVSNNGINGIIVRGSSRADIIGAVITDHTESGLVITDNSSVRWNGGEIARNGENGIFVTSHSTLRVLPGELQEGKATEIVDNDLAGIFLAQDAGAYLSGAYVPPNGNGSAITCDGKEASVDFSSSPMINPTYVDCSDPDF